MKHPQVFHTCHALKAPRRVDVRRVVESDHSIRLKSTSAPGNRIISHLNSTRRPTLAGLVGACINGHSRATRRRCAFAVVPTDRLDSARLPSDITSLRPSAALSSRQRVRRPTNSAANSGCDRPCVDMAALEKSNRDMPFVPDLREDSAPRDTTTSVGERENGGTPLCATSRHEKKSPCLQGLMSSRAARIPNRDGGFAVNACREKHGENGDSAAGGSISAAVEAKTAHFDADLQAVIDAWPALPEAIKAGILAMVRAAGNGAEG